MSYASFRGRAKLNARNPQAFGVCDRCAVWYNLNDLRYQYDYRGPRLANLRIRVCPTCTDVPFQHWRPIILPPDPVPQRDPRPETSVIDDCYVLEPSPSPYVTENYSSEYQPETGTTSGVQLDFQSPGNSQYVPLISP